MHASVHEQTCLALPAGAFTGYISRAPIAPIRTVLLPVREAQFPWKAPALFDVAKSLLPSSVYRGVPGVSWSDVAWVFTASVGIHLILVLQVWGYC